MKVRKSTHKETTFSKIPSILAIAAGKGGVGKSTVAVHLAQALKELGFEVGLLDADIYGPSLVQMLPKGIDPFENPQNPEKLFPAKAFGISFISIAHFKKEASIVRAPIANQIIEQFLTTIEWGELDYLLIDFPPGTGDIQLTLMQKANISGAILVTTPQIVATLDVRKAMQLFQRMEIPVLGIIENMSFFEIEKKRYFPFGCGGGEELAKDFSFPFLGQIPIHQKISEVGDKGESLFLKDMPIFGLLAKKIIEESKKLLQDTMLVRQKNPYHLECFVNNLWVAIPVYKIQEHCPCAKCSSVRYSGVKLSKQKRYDKEVSLLEFSTVGRYAIRMKFSSGCSQGIYPFTFLKKLLI